jgi:hypothetical protein
MALDNTGKVHVWGMCNYTNNIAICNVPRDLNNVVAITATGEVGVALIEGGTVRVWGSVDPKYTPPINLQNVVAIAGGNYHIVALKNDGTIVSWGNIIITQDTLKNNNIIAISAGNNHTLGLRIDGTVVSNGPNTF